jgi:hypothetical protein
MKQLLVLAVLCGLMSAANAADGAAAPAAAPAPTVEKDYTFTFDATFMSKYIWRGFDLFDDHAAWQPSLDFQMENGLGAKVWASYAGGSGNVDATEYDYTLYYGNSVMEDCYKTNYKVGWRYYDFIDRGSKPSVTHDHSGDDQELFLEFDMPQLIGNGFTPHGAIYHMWQARHGVGPDFPTGEIYVMGFNYDWTFEQAPELPMTASWDIVYNDGVGSSSVDHDWSHMLWGLKSNIQCPFIAGAKIIPAVYFQNSFESTVNNEDELFAALSYNLKF